MAECLCFISGNKCEKLERYFQQMSRRPAATQRAFFLMPFKQPYLDYYRFGVKEIYSRKNEYELTYGGESIFGGEYIMCKICEEIAKADLVIADLSEANSNVYYELGLAHAMGKSTITLVSQAASGMDQGFEGFLQDFSEIRKYSHIDSLKRTLMSDEEKPLKGKRAPLFVDCDERSQDQNRDEKYSVICILPIDKSEPADVKDVAQETRISFSEVHKFGITEPIKKLEFPGDDLIKLDKHEVLHLLEIARFRNIHQEGSPHKMNFIKNARYCIVDITEGYPEIFYWLGYVHGLRVNPEVDLKEGLTCIYITQGELRDIPFDIRAARVIPYCSLKDIAEAIPREIERIEVARLNQINEAKYGFWNRFTLRNTEFLIGAADMFHPGGKKSLKKIRNRLSIQDFRTFMRIVYVLLFLGARKPFQYEFRILKLHDYLDLRDQQKGSFWTNPEEFPIFIDEAILRRIWINRRAGSVENYVILGASCINVAAESVMKALYRLENENRGYLFRTIRKYKARSAFWHLIKDKKKPISKNGIYLCVCKEEAAKRSPKEVYRYDPRPFIRLAKPEYNNKGQIETDAGLIIFANRLTLSAGIKIGGEVIVLAGFSKYGTYELGRMISNYANYDEDPEEKIVVAVESSDDRKKIRVNDLMGVINDVRRKAKGRAYCVEAVFEFKNVGKERQDLRESRDPTEKVLKGFYAYDRTEGTRKSLIEEVTAYSTLRRPNVPRERGH